MRVSNTNQTPLTGFEESLRQLIREEIRRLIRPDAFAEDADVSGDDLALRERAHGVRNHDASRVSSRRSSPRAHR